jgi:hypothetical protein
MASDKSIIDVVVVSSLLRFPSFRGLWRNFFAYLDRTHQRRVELTHLRLRHKEYLEKIKSDERIQAAILTNCQKGIHKVERWKKHGVWKTTGRFTGTVISEYVVLVGKCEHCGSPLSCQLHTLGDKVPVVGQNIQFSIHAKDPWEN